MANKMKIGLHVSAAGDVSQAPLNALDFGAECFQFFSRPPQGGPAKTFLPEVIKNFKTLCDKNDFESYIHSPYYINLASAKNSIYYGSISVLRQELERGSQLGVKYLITHLGSARELGRDQGIKKTIEGIAKILDGYKGSTQLLPEISAGSGQIMGDTFEELAKIIKAPKLKKCGLGICYDTCHAFASGYDERNAAAVKKTFVQFHKVVGLKNLKVMHVNDSMGDLNSHKDRHEHIGQGKIGLEGFKAIVAFAKKQKINLILETPHDDKIKKDLAILKKLRG